MQRSSRRTGGGHRGGSAHFTSGGIVQLAFAHSTQTVFYIMAGVMAATFLVSVRLLPRGRPAPVDASDSEPNLEVASTHDVTDAPVIP